jgi:hypothetical protein
LKIAWKQPAEVFHQLYKQAADVQIAKRWQAWWMLRRRERWKRVKEVVGQPQADSAGDQGVEGGHAAFPEGKVVGEVGLLYSPEACGAGIGGCSAVGGGT